MGGGSGKGRGGCCGHERRRFSRNQSAVRQKACRRGGAACSWRIPRTVWVQAQAHAALTADDVQHPNHLAEHEHPAWRSGRDGRTRRWGRGASRSSQPCSPGSPWRQTASQRGSRTPGALPAARAAPGGEGPAESNAAAAPAAHLCPVCLSRVSSLSRSTILPDVTTRRVTTSSSPTARRRYSSCSRRRRTLSSASSPRPRQHVRQGGRAGARP